MYKMMVAFDNFLAIFYESLSGLEQEILVVGL
jgi:hypothetical protein